jgi:hypothetical protein
MRAPAIIAALLISACTGCGVTAALWRHGHEGPLAAEGLRVSERGDVRLDYTARIPNPADGSHLKVHRALVVPAADMEKLLLEEGVGTIALIHGKQLTRHVFPRQATSQFDVKAIPGGGPEWRPASLARSDTFAEFTYVRTGQQSASIPSEMAVIFELPTRSALTPTDYWRRVLLTPPAAVGDAALAAAVIVSAPVWLPVVTAYVILYPPHFPD